MALAVVEEVIALLGLVGEVVLGHLTECRESKHSKRTRQTSDSTATGLDRTLEQLTMDVLHVLKQGNKRVLLRGRRDDTSLRQHVLLAARLEFHLVHEVLDASLVKDTIGVDEKDEQVVVALDVLAVDLVDELEGPLLAMALTTVGETRHSDTTAAVDDIDGLGVRIKGERHTELLNGVQVQLVFLVSVEGEEDVKTGWRVLAVDERVASSEQNLGDFLVTRHDNDDLGSGSLVKNRLDTPGATNGVGDELVDTEQPWNGQKTGERPESEPLQNVNHLLGKVLDDLRREWQSDNHDWQKDGTGRVSRAWENKWIDLPETEEKKSEKDGQNANTHCLCLLEDFNNAVQERGNPQEPLEECREHDSANDSNINNLLQSVRVLGDSVNGYSRP
jgi:hypothetical protein